VPSHLISSSSRTPLSRPAAARRPAGLRLLAAGLAVGLGVFVVPAASAAPGGDGAAKGSSASAPGKQAEPTKAKEAKKPKKAKKAKRAKPQPAPNPNAAPQATAPKPQPTGGASQGQKPQKPKKAKQPKEPKAPKAQGGTQGGGTGSPPGNNGTVKIAPYGEMDGIPQNSPHPGCEFQVEWYGFDEGADVISTVTFTPQAPTADVVITVDGPSTVWVGEDAAGGAGNDPDGVATYRLSFDGEPHPQQGYHVRLTVSTPRSNGNDTKTKVFWVAGCDETPTPGGTPGDEPATGTPDEGTPGESTGGGEPGSDDPGTTEAGGLPQTAVASGAVTADPVVGTSATPPSSVDAGLVPAWARSWAPLVLVALGIALVLAAALRPGRVRTRP